MGDLHQYEIRYHWTEETTGGCITKKRLEWAYTVQEACFQLDLEMKLRADRYYLIMEAGPVKLELTCPANHYHVCPGCQDVTPCAGCGFQERSDLQEPCHKCIGKRPHQHHCALCQANYDCGWIQKNGYCWTYNHKDVPCTKHTLQEAQAFYQAKLDAEKKTPR